MITITLPEWLSVLFSVAGILWAAGTLMQSALNWRIHFLERQLKRMEGKSGE